MLVYAPTCNAVFYPDLTVTCAAPEFSNTRLATLLNPTLIIKVLSDSTEAHDRGDKFACYRSIVSLSTYVLVAQNRPIVEVFTRQSNGLWQLEEFSGLEAVVPLPAIGISLRLADIYARVQFPVRLMDRTEEGATENEERSQ